MARSCLCKHRILDSRAKNRSIQFLQGPAGFGFFKLSHYPTMTLRQGLKQGYVWLWRLTEIVHVIGWIKDAGTHFIHLATEARTDHLQKNCKEKMDIKAK